MLPNDYELKSSDLQQLSNRDAIIALFANLGYDTGARLKQTSAAMGFNAALAREVVHIERLASHEDGQLQVYLIEMKHTTVALTQALARALRNMPGTFLLVLTVDYERLDFVLMELTQPEAKGGQAYRRPRVLTLDRRDPGPVALRALRRFSYTEIDVDYQLDKLRSAYGVAEWSEPLFNNRALFSDYYLKERLPGAPEWAEAGGAGPALRTFQGLMADVRQRISGKDERTARSQLIEPALRALGFDPHPLFPPDRGTAGERVEPHYLLLTQPSQDSKGCPGPKPVAYCNAYQWDRNLDGRDEKPHIENPDENPGALVVSLLERDDAADWAIVTNGKAWRLYSRRAHSRATNYYEIDLEETVASPDPGYAFRYFYLLFRAGAFTPPSPALPPSATGEGRCFLDRLVADSALYAKELGERLKDRVFGEIFTQFAAGFIADMRAHGAEADLVSAQLDAVFQGTLTFLYRLLFLLYAEARDLLPVRQAREYDEISLTRLKGEVAERAGAIRDEAPARLEKAYSATTTGLYDRLMRLFAVIDEGDPAVNVPVYNGGLFITRPTADDPTTEAANARFLAAHQIPDRYLALGLDSMARDLDSKTHALAPIDYKSLGVRQLGSIYEGLLEFKLRIAPAKMAVVKGKKTDEVIPYRQAEAAGRRVRATYHKGQVYLENDKHERKATGSYYTPDYIVKYIVQNTVGPVLADKCEALTPRIRQAERRFQETIQRKQALEKVDPDRPALLLTMAGDLLRDLFDVKLLDPAMGSGHFLVEGVDFITDRLVQFMSRFRFLSYFFAGTRRTILSEMERQGVTVDPARLSDVNLLKRHVLKRCIYGVDLNPMAVELAKVSLWLDCFTLGAPLSFLDHHLKCGNSLIGARVAEVREAVEFGYHEQMTLFASSQFAGVMLATDLMRHVGELSDVTAEQVRASRAEYRRASDALAPFRRILDVYTSRWFGNPVSKGKRGRADVDQALDFLRSAEAQAWLERPEQAKGLSAEQQRVAGTALQAAQERRFFHWELEFPEVFFGPAAGATQAIALKEHGGFDAVVGNPPWVDVQEIVETTKAFLREGYTSARGKCDLYALFVERGIRLLNHNGRFSMIVQSKFLFTEYGSGLRSFLAECATLDQIVHFSDAPLFGALSVYPLVLIAVSGQRKRESVIVVRFSPRTDLTAIERALSHDALRSRYTTQRDDALFRSESAWQIDLPSFLEESSRVRQLSVPFADLCESIAYGIKTNLDDVYLADSDTWRQRNVEKALIKPAIKPRDFERYEFTELEQSILFPYIVEQDGLRLINLTEYEGARSYLESHRDALAKRRFYGKTIIEQGLEFYELPYISSFSRSAKLAFPTIASRARFALDLSGEMLFVAPCYVVHLRRDADPMFLVSILNSRLVDMVIRVRSTELAGGYMEMQRQYVEAIPIRRISFTTPAVHREALAKEGITEATEWIERTELPSVKSSSFRSFSDSRMGRWLDARLSAAPEESDAVHDLLAYLAKQMIDLNKHKQAEQRRFLGWLEGAINPHPSPSPGGRGVRGAGLDALTGKSRLRNYLGDYQKGEPELTYEELEDILFKNRTRLGVSLSDTRFTARLRAEYEGSLALLRPIKARLARTDALIDRVVYRLYGLSEGEVAIVEGKQ